MKADFGKLLLAEGAGKEATIVFKRIRINQICAVKGESVEVHIPLSVHNIHSSCPYSLDTPLSTR